MRTGSIAVAALAVLALGSTLSACGSPGGNAAGGHLAVTSSPTPSSPRHSSPPLSPVSVPPNIAVIRLGASFSPGSLRLGVGQQFLLIVSTRVRATGLDGAGCGSAASGTVAASGTAASGLLSVRCTSGGYLYTVEHRGTGTISATVRPHCGPRLMCQQWLARAQLHVTIT
jgi:hypothetical protein